MACKKALWGRHRGFRQGDGTERRAKTRPGKALCTSKELKCCFLGNKKPQMPEEGCQEQGCQQQAGEKAKCSDDYRSIQTAAARGLGGRQWADIADVARGRPPGPPAARGEAHWHIESEQPVTSLCVVSSQNWPQFSSPRWH